MRLSYEVLYTILSEEDADRVCRMLKGATVTFPKAQIEHRDICNSFRELVSMGVKEWEAIKRLSEIYQKDKSQIWRIVKDNGERDRERG